MNVDQRFVNEMFEVHRDLMRVLKESFINPVQIVMILDKVKHQFICENFDGDMIDEYRKLTGQQFEDNR